jgi:hypothetical protein
MRKWHAAILGILGACTYFSNEYGSFCPNIISVDEVNSGGVVSTTLPIYPPFPLPYNMLIILFARSITFPGEIFIHVYPKYLYVSS